jgi:hypothetical protein
MSNHEDGEFAMTAATTSRTSAARRSWPRRWIPALAGLGLIAPAVIACGSSASTPAPAPAAPSSSPAPASSAAAFPGVVGTAAAVSGSSIEVQNPTTGQVTVTFTATTPITETVAVTSKDVAVGSCVTVTGQPAATGTTGAATRSVTATTVTVSAPVNGSCGGAGGFGGLRGTASPRPSFSPRPRPSGSRGAFGGGAFGGANGKVTSLSASGFVVQGRNPAAGAGTSITVTTTTATKYLKVVTVGASALKVGECITAAGPANSIGAVAARSIRISQPGPNGCVTAFGGRRGAGGPTANA